MNVTAIGITLTGPQAAMLATLRDACDKNPSGRAAPRQLAKMRWPSSEAWNRRTRFGATSNQGAVGGTMPMKAATLLWRLHDKRMASKDLFEHRNNLWEITEFGRRWLAEAGI